MEDQVQKQICGFDGEEGQVGIMVRNSSLKRSHTDVEVTDHLSVRLPVQGAIDFEGRPKHLRRTCYPVS